MKRLLASLALLLALASPAHAAITQIVGSGTGGAIGTTNGLTVSSIVITTNATVPSGSLIVVTISIRNNSATITGCVDSALNTYTIRNATGGTNADGALAYSNTTGTLASGGTITCTPSAALNASSIASAWNGVVTSSPVDPASPAATAGSSATLSAGTTRTLAFPGTTELLIGSVAYATSSTLTESSGFTSLGTQTSFMPLHSAYQIVTSNAPITYAPTLVSSTTFTGILVAFLQATGGGTPVCKRELLGVGC